ncbi:MAG: Spy/CpxP family protein refolding chaperone [Polyangiaceae bacterium]
MHPGFIGFWKHAQRTSACGDFGHGQHAHAHGHDHDHGGRGFRGWHGGPAGFASAFASGEDEFGGGFGVRRPLRFLAHKLELEETQVEELAAVLNELKTERAQAAVDLRRTTSAFADLVDVAEFDATKAEAVAASRVKATEAREAAVARALGKIHRILNEEQRKRLSYLLRTGALSI